MNDNDCIGYLVAFPNFTGVCCQECLDASDMKDAKDPKPVPIHRINIGSYKQTCHGCGKILVKPRTSIWPELFTKTDIEQLATDIK
jgi:hypothetical protein